MPWLTIIASVVLPILFFGVRWLLRRSARQEGREEVLFDEVEGRSDAQDKAHKAAHWWRSSPSALKRMHDAYKRKRKDGV